MRPLRCVHGATKRNSNSPQESRCPTRHFMLAPFLRGFAPLSRCNPFYRKSEQRQDANHGESCFFRPHVSYSKGDSTPNRHPGRGKMTEFQMATLEISRSGLDISQTGIWISAIHALITLVVGGIQCFLILYGLKQMNRASVARDKQHEETMAALDTRHRESMRALETLIERTSK